MRVLCIKHRNYEQTPDLYCCNHLLSIFQRNSVSFSYQSAVWWKLWVLWQFGSCDCHFFFKLCLSGSFLFLVFSEGNRLGDSFSCWSIQRPVLRPLIVEKILSQYGSFRFSHAQIKAWGEPVMDDQLTSNRPGLQKAAQLHITTSAQWYFTAIAFT